jgi:hypothetical protein
MDTSAPSVDAVPERPGPRPGMAGKIAWLVRDLRVRDQLLTSLLNMAVPLVAAVVLDAHGVGAVWIASGAYQVAIAICRGYVALPGQMAIGERWRRGEQGAVGPWRDAIRVPLLLGALTFAVGLAIPDQDVRHSLLVMAPMLPVLLLLDCARHWAYALRRVDAPARASLLWSVLHGGALVIALAAGPTAATLTAAWAIPGVVAGLVLARSIRPYTDPGLGHGAPLGQRLFLATDAFAGQLAVFVVPAVAGVIATLADVGVFQNSRLLFRPVNVLLNLLLVAGIPLVTAADIGPARLERTRNVATRTVTLTLALTALGIATYAVAMLTSIELSWVAIVFAAAESVAVGPYVIYALLATTMMRAGVLLGVRLAAIAVQLAGVLALARYGPGGLAAASLLGMLVPSVVVPLWATRTSRREHAAAVTLPLGEAPA